MAVIVFHRLHGIMSRLASPVISTTIQCDTCITSNLSSPVQVTFKHLPYDQVCAESCI